MEFLGNNKIVKYSIAAVVAFAAFFLVRKLYNKIRNQENEIEYIFGNDAMENAIKKNATISKARAAQLCEQIKSSWGFLNDNETSIYNAFKQINNEYDLGLLISMYDYNGENLQQSITKRMSNKERAKINEILFSKGIDVTF